MINRRLWVAVLVSIVGCAASVTPAAPPLGSVNPYPRAIARSETVGAWTFGDGMAGWRAVHECTAAVRDGVLAIRSTGSDPHVGVSVTDRPGLYRARLTARCKGTGVGQFYWLTEGTGWDEDKVCRFPLKHDGNWHTYEETFEVKGPLTGFRFDPGMAPGTAEVREIVLSRIERHPLEIVQVDVRDRSAWVWVRNHGDRRRAARCRGESVQLQPGGTAPIRVRDVGTKAFERVTFSVTSEGVPALARAVYVHRPERDVKGPVLQNESLQIRVAADGSGARILRGGTCVAVLAPIVARPDGVSAFRVATMTDRIELRGPEHQAEISLRGSEIDIIIAGGPCEGPVVRVPGALEQGLLAGVEYLGKGERSSSKLDIEGPEYLRVEPDPMNITMPLAAFVTADASVALSWDKMELQPVFAAPNFIDGAADHRMSLKGGCIHAVIRVAPGWNAGGRLEDAILWAARRQGLPPVPKAPRTREEQWKLCLKALDGPLKGENGWSHAATWDQDYFVDFVSTIWRMTGKVPETPRLAYGCAHIGNPAALFLAGRVAEWRDHIDRVAADYAGRQGTDGSYGHDGKMSRTHFEKTASGICADFAVPLLEHARYTGSRKSLAAAEKALAYIERFRTPRGSQIWEIPLHAPDLLATARLVRAYTRAYELTGKDAYLVRARRWALTGVPFVYLWGAKPIMTYGTVCTYGATHWKAPVWIGRPVQWVGIVYAYDLLMLAEHDRTLDWRKLAEGILVAGEQMQPTKGPNIGCLADNIELESQAMFWPWINPCTLVALRMRLAGELFALDVARDGDRVVVAPFPVRIRDGKAEIRAEKGVKYQVLIDGRRVVDVESKGLDDVSLD